MSAEHGTSAPLASLLAVLADPAIVVDGDGRIAGWNEAARVRFALDETSLGDLPGTRLARWQGGARRVPLEGGRGAVVVWSLDADGLGPDELALSKERLVERISGSLFHELGNALNLGIGLGGLIAMEPALPPDLAAMALDLERHGQRAQHLAHALVEFVRLPRAAGGPVQVAPLIRETFGMFGHATVNMEHRVSAPDGLPEVDAGDAALRHALVALLVNALEAQGVTWSPGASPQPGRLVVSASALDDADGERVRIAIEDGAPTVPESEREALFAGGSARGTQDLIVAATLIAQEGGRLWHQAIPDGNRMVVDLPVAHTTLDADTSAFASPTTVLVGDEDVFVRSLLVHLVERRGLEAVEARSAHEALEQLAARDVCLVIADAQLPGRSAAELYAAAIAQRPSLARRFILTAANPEDPDLVEFAARTGVPLLPKPFENAELDSLVDRALQG